MRKTFEQRLLDRDFDHHPPPTTNVGKMHAEVRARFKEVAQHLERNLPDCRERSLARTKLEEGMMWANAAIARELSADIHHPRRSDRQVQAKVAEPRDGCPPEQT